MLPLFLCCYINYSPEIKWWMSERNSFWLTFLSEHYPAIWCGKSLVLCPRISRSRSGMRLKYWERHSSGPRVRRSLGDTVSQTPIMLLVSWPQFFVKLVLTLRVRGVCTRLQAAFKSVYIYPIKMLRCFDKLCLWKQVEIGNLLIVRQWFAHVVFFRRFRAHITIKRF